ncbi:MAG: hypothetical protein RLO12_04345, partial [Fulvivirga sp.]
EKANNGMAKANYVMREVLFFREEYQRLKSQIDFAKEFSDGANDYIKSLVKEASAGGEGFKRLWNDTDFLEKTASNYSNFKTKQFTIGEKVRKLQAHVKEYGYHLALTNEKITYPDGTDITLKEGLIYQISKKQITWHTQHQRWKTVRRRIGCNSFHVRVPYAETQWHSEIVSDYKEVDITTDMVQQEINELRVTQGKDLHLAIKTKEQFVNEEGTPISDILRMCEESESKRVNTVIVIPEYDNVITNKSYFVGAYFYHNPLPGMVPVKYPNVGLMEELSYRMIWMGTELGQLVSSINLAPGETRTITAVSKFTQTTSQTASFKTINDLNTSESFDLSTEFQKEASKELKRNNSFSASASGSGSYGPFSAKASASGSRSSSLNTFQKEMNRIAKKVTRSINTRISQEVSSTISDTTEVSQENTKTMQITNVNQGSTLNLMFYQVNNRFQGGLYLNELELLVGGTKELIAGSRIFETTQFKLHELEDAFKLLHPKNLPGTVKGKPGYNDYWVQLLIALAKELRNEYSMEVPDPDGSESARLLNFQGEMEQLPLTMSNVGSAEDYFKELVNILKKRDLDDTIGLGREKMSIASGALYADSFVGINPSTELYSEQMRELEMSRIKSEIESTNAQNDIVKAKTKVLLEAENYITKITVYEAVQNNLLGFSTQLQLKEQVPDAKYDVYVDGIKIDKTPVTLPGNTAGKVLIAFFVGEKYTEEYLDDKLTLIHQQTKVVIRKY